MSLSDRFLRSFGLSPVEPRSTRRGKLLLGVSILFSVPGFPMIFLAGVRALPMVLGYMAFFAVFVLLKWNNRRLRFAVGALTYVALVLMAAGSADGFGAIGVLLMGGAYFIGFVYFTFIDAYLTPASALFSLLLVSGVQGLMGFRQFSDSRSYQASKTARLQQYGDPAKMMRDCDLIKDDRSANECARQVVMWSKNSQLCDFLSSQARKDWCKLFAPRDKADAHSEAELCAQLRDKVVKEQCFYYLQLKDPFWKGTAAEREALCLKVRDTYVKEDCLTNYILTTGGVRNAKLCDSFVHQDGKEYCLHIIQMRTESR